MRYLTYYGEYPIYEPAEGGYYYAGNEVTKSDRISKRKCRDEFEKIWQQCLEENRQNGFSTDLSNYKERIQFGIYPWIRLGDTEIRREGHLIGEGESIVIERKLGSQRKGWEPYC